MYTGVKQHFDTVVVIVFVFYCSIVVVVAAVGAYTQFIGYKGTVD